MGITFEIPTPNMKGNGCLILAYSTDRQWTRLANPGEVINWTMYNMPCAKDYTTPDTLTSTLQLMQQDPQAISSGSWQEARQLLR